MFTLDHKHFEIIVAHAKAEYPREACGILAGKDKRATHIYKMANVDQSSTTYYIDPKEQFRVMKDIRIRDLDMIGIYHSHVATAPYPSPTDVKLAFYPDSLHFIISLADFDFPIIKAYRIREEKIEEEEIEIVED